MKYISEFYQFQETIFNIFIAISWLLLLLTLTGVLNDYPDVFNSVTFYMKIYICLFLIWRFNPIRQFVVNKSTTFTSLDRKIAFSAGLIVLNTTAIREYLLYVKSQVTPEKQLTT